MSNKVKVIIVDDDANLLKSYKRVLGRKKADSQDTQVEENDDQPVFFYNIKYELTTFTSGKEAVKEVLAATKAGDNYAIAFVDINLDVGENGVDIAEQIRDIDFRINIVMVTGDCKISLEDISSHILPPENLLYLEKPVSNPEIKQCTAALAAKWLAENQAERMRMNMAEKVRERTKLLSEEVRAREGMETILRRKSNYLNTILEYVQAGILLVKKDTGMIVDINPYGCELLRCQKNDVIGKPYLKFIIDPNQILKDNPGELHELSLIAKDGSHPRVLINSIMMQEENEDYILKTMIDIKNIQVALCLEY